MVVEGLELVGECDGEFTAIVEMSGVDDFGGIASGSLSFMPAPVLLSSVVAADNITDGTWPSDGSIGSVSCVIPEYTGLEDDVPVNDGFVKVSES